MTDRMRAFVTDGNGSGAVALVPKPTPGQNEILVRVHYAALNPGDRKLLEGGPASTPARSGLIAGCDFAGTVEDANGTRWRAGQRVAGWVVGASFDGIGAYAEYVKVGASLVYAVPENITLAEAATLPLAYATAITAMYRTLALPQPYQPKGQPDDFLVYGASASIGQYAIQLAKLSGLRVIAVASRKNHEHLKTLGADILLDYHDGDWVERAREATQGTLKYAFDAVTEAGTPEKVVSVLARVGGSRLVVLAPVDKDALRAINPQADVETIGAHVVFGRPLGDPLAINRGGSPSDDLRAWEAYLVLLTDMLERGDLVPNRVRELGGLADIPQGFLLSKEGTISAQKGVFRVPD